MRLALPVWAMLGTWLGADALVLPRDDSALADPSIPPIAALARKFSKPKDRGFAHSGSKTPPKQPPKEERMFKKSELDAREPVGGSWPMYHSPKTAKTLKELFSDEEPAKKESDAPRDLNARGPVGGTLPMYSPTTAKKLKEIFSGEEPAKKESDAPRDLSARAPVAGGFSTWWPTTTAKKGRGKTSSGDQSAGRGRDIWDAPPRDPAPDNKAIAARDEEVSGRPRDLSARAPVAGGFSTWYPTTAEKGRGKTSSDDESAEKGWDAAPPHDPAPENKEIAARDEKVSGRPPVAKPPPSEASRFTRTGRITEIRMGTSSTVGKEPVESTGPKPSGTEDKDRNLVARGTGENEPLESTLLARSTVENEPLESTLAARDTSSEPSVAQPMRRMAQRPRRPQPDGDGDGDEKKHDKVIARDTTADPAAPNDGHERVATSSEAGREEQRAGRAEILDCDKRLGLAGQYARVYKGTVGGDSRKGTSRISSCSRTRFRPALSEDLEPPAAP